MGRCEAVEAAIAGRSGCWLRVAAGVGSWRRRGGRCRDPPGGRGAQAGLKQPHPLSRKPLPASPSRHNARKRHSRRRAAGGPQPPAQQTAARGGGRTSGPSAGATRTPKPSSAGPLAISRAGRGEDKASPPAPPHSAPPRPAAPRCSPGSVASALQVCKSSAKRLFCVWLLYRFAGRSGTLSHRHRRMRPCCYFCLMPEN